MKTSHLGRATKAMKEFHGSTAMFLKSIDDTIAELEATAEAIKGELPTLHDLRKHVEEAGTKEPALPSALDDEMEDELTKGLTGFAKGSKS